MEWNAFMTDVNANWEGPPKVAYKYYYILPKETIELPNYSIFCHLRTTIESVCLPINNDTYVDV